MHPVNSLQSYTGVSRVEPYSAADLIHLGHAPLAAHKLVGFTIAKSDYFSGHPAAWHGTRVIRIPLAHAPHPAEYLGWSQSLLPPGSGLQGGRRAGKKEDGS